jgi:hypothetical protein
MGAESHMTTRGFRCLFLARLAVLMAILGAWPLQAQFLVLPVNLAYLTQRADIIVQGRVTDVRYEGMPGYANVPTVEVTLAVEKMVRGPEDSTYTFREMLIGVQPKAGKQAYQVGQRLFLFLLTPSRYGLSSPIGFEQGRFHIAGDSGGGEMVANELSNAGLFKNVPEAASRAGTQLSSSEMRTATVQRGPVPLDDFVALVRRLTSLPRIQ